MRRGFLFWVLCLSLTVAGSASAAGRGSGSKPSHRPAKGQTGATHKRASRKCVSRAPKSPSPAKLGADWFMFGQRTVFRSVDRLPAGFAQGVPVRSRADGTISSISVYVGGRNQARKLSVALYSYASCRPGTRLTAGSRLRPRAGRWNTVRVRPIRVRAGNSYRIVVLGVGGTLEVRQRITNGCVRDLARHASGRSMPKRWTARSRRQACAFSAYARGLTITHGTLSGVGSGGSGGSAPTPVTLGPPRILIPSLYVAQSAAGLDDGSSCASAHSVDWFNSPSSWGSGVGQIGAGAVVGLCGTISSPLVAQGSGTSSSPITVYWLPGSTMSSPDWGGGAAFDTNGQTYLTLNGGLNGSIQATQLGTGLADQGSFARAIAAQNCSGCTFANLTIANFYVHTSLSDNSVDATQDNGILFSGSNITIANNVVHDIGWALYADWGNGDGNNAIYGNDIYNVDHGIASTTGVAGGNFGPLYIYDNNIHDFANWDTNTNDYHHDGIHCYTVVSQPGASHYSGLYIYDNRFGGTVGNSTTADIFMEGNYGSSGATPCSDATSSVYIFNNVFSSTDAVTDNPYLTDSAGDGGMYNNTVLGQRNTQARGGCISYTDQPPGAKAALENNILSNCNNLIGGDPTNDYVSGSPDYNVYASGGSNSFVCNGNFYNFSQFSNWQTCMSADSHSKAMSSAILNSDGSPQSGSPAIGEGTNLTSLCSGQPNPGLGALCENINGTPRPTTGPWNAGAY